MKYKNNLKISGLFRYDDVPSDIQWEVGDIVIDSGNILECKKATTERPIESSYFESLIKNTATAEDLINLAKVNGKFVNHKFISVSEIQRALFDEKIGILRYLHPRGYVIGLPENTDVNSINYTSSYLVDDARNVRGLSSTSPSKVSGILHVTVSNEPDMSIMEFIELPNDRLGEINKVSIRRGKGIPPSIVWRDWSTIIERSYQNKAQTEINELYSNYNTLLHQIKNKEYEVLTRNFPDTKFEYDDSNASSRNYNPIYKVLVEYYKEINGKKIKIRSWVDVHSTLIKLNKREDPFYIKVDRSFDSDIHIRIDYNSLELTIDLEKVIKSKKKNDIAPKFIKALTYR